MYLPDGHLLQNGKYKLAGIIGQGGFGITYKGIWYTEVKGSLGKLNTEIQVCIKEYFFKDYCLRDADTHAVNVHSETGRILFHKFKEKLISEARILSELYHPYVVHVLEVFEENNTAYIVMEYIAGSSLKQRLEQVHTLTENRVLKYIRQIGEALQFVHEKNILHLDIKPSNILIDHEDKARLIDFGVSKRYDIEQQETSTTMLTLSKGFASIEQYDDEGTLIFSPCPDVYSLGATMYNLLTGKIPVESILRATKELVEPKTVNPLISEKTNAAILKAMQVVPADRFHSVAEMLDNLDMPSPEVENEPIPSQRVDAGSQDETTLLHSSTNDNDLTILNQPSSPVVKSKKKRKRVLVSVLMLAIVGLVLASILYVYNLKPDEQTEMENEAIVDPNPVSAPDEKENLPLIQDVKPTEQIQEQPKVVPQPATETPPEGRPSEQAVSATPQITVPENNGEQPRLLSEAEKDSIYNVFLTLGNGKMSKAAFAEAKIDFDKASEMKPTKEIFQLILSAEEGMKKQQIVERKALYEEMMPFGRYKIARKIATGKYGAIDDEGNEVIPCVYQIAYRAEKGRAFLREDKLFDIYGENGQRTDEAVANYIQ